MSEPRTLFELVPAVHRVRDAAQGRVLEGLLAVLEDEVGLLREDVERLYDNWFVETCDDWVVPYIGDLIGVRGLLDVRGTRHSQRGLVANTIAARRRKGTLAIVEQIAFDVTGWPAKAVEFFQLLGWTQNVNHVRLGRGGTAALGDANALELVDGPFDTAAHTADVRHIDSRRGRHNIPNIGVFLWRLASYDLEGASARADAAHAGRYTFHPLGIDSPLFSRPRTEEEIEHLAEELNVPGRLRRRALHDELAAGVPDDPSDADDGVERFLDPGDPVFELHLDAVRVKLSELAICDLSDPARGAPTGKKAAVDPQLGRIALDPAAPAPAEVTVAWSYGFPGDIGGGPYDRRESLAAVAPRPDSIDWQVGVVGNPPAGATELTATLTGPDGALTRWGGLVEVPPVALVAVMDSRTYPEALNITVPAGATLIIAAAKWDDEPDPLTAVRRRLTGHAAARGVRPHLLGDVTVTGAAPTGDEPGGTLVLDGLLVEGGLTVAPGALAHLRVAHCTLTEGLAMAGGNVGLEIDVDHSVARAIDVAGSARLVSIRDTILDGAGGPVLTAPATAVERSTVLGTSAVRSIQASDSIFTGAVDVERRQTGCVRYSYLPRASRVPRRFRCRPDSAAEEARVVPAFTSTDLGDPGYAQLATDCPEEIAAGAQDEGEMGAFNFVQAPQRMANLRARLDEYLRFGLEAGTFFVT